MQNPLAILLVTLSLLVPAVDTFAQNDRIRLRKTSQTGEITKMTPLAVTIERGGNRNEISVAEIQSIQFGDEPSELSQARVNARNGSYDTALDKLKEIKPSGLTSYVRQEIEYLTAYCGVRRALLGEGSYADAGRQLNQFVAKNSQSYHFIAANELLGDLLVAMQRYDAAEAKYELVAKAPWPSYAIRAKVLLGRVLQAQGKHREALAKFDEALSASASDEEAKQQRQFATLAKAESLAATGEVKEGVAAVQALLKESSPEDRPLNAAAYNALGVCHQQAGDVDAALLAFLHVDLLYNTVPEAHAQALSYLAQLWQKAGKPAEAREAREQLNTLYAKSKWAKQT